MTETQMKTEAEAKACWCPFARVCNSDEGGSYNRIEDNEPFPSSSALCMASACMAWRWGPFTDVIGKETRDPGTNISTFEEPRPSRGYCGLAGKP